MFYKLHHNNTSQCHKSASSYPIIAHTSISVSLIYCIASHHATDFTKHQQAKSKSKFNYSICWPIYRKKNRRYGRIGALITCM